MIALGGTGYAAVSVTGRDIRNGTIRGADIANGTITSSKIRNRAIKGADIAVNTISTKNVRDASLEGRDFKAGQLAAGVAGPPGPPGANAMASVIVRGAHSPGLIAAGATSRACRRERALLPARSRRGGESKRFNTAGAPNTLQAFAICAGP